MSDRKGNSKTLTKRGLTRRRNAARRLTARRKTPLGRLHTDGSCKPENIGRRLQWLAHERQIPEKDLPKVQCDMTDELFDFAEKYHVSLDWLLCGDLKGLREMRRGCPSRPQQPVLTPDELQRPSALIIAAIEAADRDQIEFLLAYCRQIIKNGGDAA